MQIEFRVTKVRLQHNVSNPSQKVMGFLQLTITSLASFFVQSVQSILQHEGKKKKRREKKREEKQSSIRVSLAALLINEPA